MAFVTAGTSGSRRFLGRHFTSTGNVLPGDSTIGAGEPSSPSNAATDPVSIVADMTRRRAFSP